MGTGNHSLRLVNPKIVNGGQTARVIYNVGSEILGRLGDGSVAVKIVETNDQGIIESIAIASNTQSRIGGRDLKAFDPLQEKLALGLRRFGFFYRRKRGDKLTGEQLPEIDMARAGQILLAFVAGEPTKCKTSSNEIFSDLYEQAFNPAGLTAELLLSAHLIHEEVERFRAKALAEQRRLSRISYDETWIIEGHFHVLFVIGELMKRREIALSEYEKGCALLGEAMEIVNRFVEHHRGRSAYRLFRLSTSKSDILRLVDQTPGGIRALRQLEFGF
jgi:hypothetical protein